MKKYLFVLFLVCPIMMFSQKIDYRKDDRSQIEKEDALNKFQSSELNSLDVIQALDYAGIRIHKFKLTPFEKKYKITIILDEYENSEKVKTVELFKGDNTYFYSSDSIITEASIPYYDFIDQLLFITKEELMYSKLTISTYSISSRNHKLNRKELRDTQYYNWRRYYNHNWELNKYIPLLVYASSWYDSDSDIERFCGTVDLSQNKKDTDNLLKKSPHYFVISYQVSE